MQQTVDRRLVTLHPDLLEPLPNERFSRHARDYTRAYFKSTTIVRPPFIASVKVFTTQPRSALKAYCTTYGCPATSSPATDLPVAVSITSLVQFSSLPDTSVNVGFPYCQPNFSGALSMLVTLT